MGRTVSYIIGGLWVAVGLSILLTPTVVVLLAVWLLIRVAGIWFQS
jgi:hypothetical protein